MPRPTPRKLGTSGIVLLALAVILYFVTRNNNAVPVIAPIPGSQGAPGAPRETPTAQPDSEGVPQPNQLSDSTLRIGSWNIEWLGKPAERSGAARDVPQSPDDIAEYIIASGVSVLAVQEIIATSDGLPIRSRELEAAIERLESHSGDQWDYTLFRGRQQGDQLTGVLWNTSRVTALDTGGDAWSQNDSAYTLSIPRARSRQNSALWNRPPHAMKFRAGENATDFVVVVLHMKADYEGDFSEHRTEEAQALLKALDGVRTAFNDQDVVLLGDTNCTEDPEPALEAFEIAGFHDSNSRQDATHWRGGSMDKILTPKSQSEFASIQFEVESDVSLEGRRLSPEQFKRRLSDHYMVVATIRVIDDDD